jgi:putative zinc finger/helix-turn-helix YgiT family protein
MESGVCPGCRQGRLVRQVVDLETLVDSGRGAIRRIVVRDVETDYCPRCRKTSYPRPSQLKIAAAQRQALGLLSAAEIRRLRAERTQRQMSELLGIGEKTYTRWESARHFQSEAFDRLLRLLAASPEAWRQLERIAAAKEENLAACASHIC